MKRNVKERSRHAEANGRYEVGEEEEARDERRWGTAANQSEEEEGAGVVSRIRQTLRFVSFRSVRRRRRLGPSQRPINSETTNDEPPVRPPPFAH